MIGVYKIPLHDAFLYSIIDASMPHPDTLDREGDLVHAVYVNRDGKIEHLEDFRNGVCVSIKDYSYQDNRIVSETETFPETGGVNEIVYRYNSTGFVREYRTFGELDYSEDVITDDAGQTRAVYRRGNDGRVLVEHKLNNKGDIVFFHDESHEISYDISYDRNGKPGKISYVGEGIRIVEKYFYIGDFLDKQEIWYDDECVQYHEYMKEADGVRTTEKIFDNTRLLMEIIKEDDTSRGHFFQIRKQYHARLVGGRYGTRYGTNSGKYEIKYGKDGLISELLSSNDNYFDPVLKVNFEPNAYYFLEPEDD